jgi:hypothetical protein
LPWDLRNPKRLAPGKRYTWCHRVYVGVRPTHEWVRLLERVISGPRTDEHELERLTGRGFLASFDVDADGNAVADQYAPAAFAFAFGRLRRGLEPSDLASELRLATERHRQRLAQIVSEHARGHRSSDVIGWEDIAAEADAARAPIGPDEAPSELRVIVRSTREELGEQDDEPPPPSRAKDFFDSFFSRDLEKVRQELAGGSREAAGAALLQFLGPPVDVRARIDVLRDPGAFAARLGPDVLTRGRWPSSAQHPLMLAQQAAVGMAMTRLRDGSGIVAINGPPGTGKTTLLRDIVADIVVDRAQRIAAVKDPWHLFEEQRTVFGQRFYPLRANVVDQTGIVVTSSNNAAVENISRELPLRDAIESEAYGHPSYLGGVAENLFLEHGIDIATWGLIAAPLGNSRNRRRLAAAFRFDSVASPTATSLSRWLDSYEEHVAQEAVRRSVHRSVVAAEPWRAAKVEFVEALASVERIRQSYDDYDRASRGLGVARAQRAETLRALTEAQEALAARTSHVDAIHKKLAAARETALLSRDEARQHAETMHWAHEAARKQLAAVHQRGRWWVRGLWALGALRQRRREWRVQLERATAAEQHTAEAIARATADAQQADDAWHRACSALEMARAKTAVELDGLRTQAGKLEDAIKHADQHTSELQRTLSQVERPRSRRSSELRGLERIEKDVHLESAWVDPEFDGARSRLFLAALRLHEATLLACSFRARANLQVAASLLRGSTPEPPAGDAGLVWSFIFFCVPVISTTLASFGAMFGGLGREAIGWLLIDEAGQATPQSVVGALWRSKRALVIGDPLQVEPVVTQPGAVIRALRQRHGVGAEWSPMTESAQTLADRGMAVGTYLRASQVWTGMPLRAHRRCGSPMFETANAIAYDGQMVQAVKNRAPLTAGLGPSAWFDVKGAPIDGHVVFEELHALDQILDRMKESWPSLPSGQDARVFAISPFRKVAEAVEATLQAHRRAIEKAKGTALLDSGTVHTFQGKEADVVILVLGSATGEKGAGSRAWAAAKPNLLNVAVTRAKSAIYVVGNWADWSSCRGFDYLARELRRIYVQASEAKPVVSHGSPPTEVRQN